MCNVPVQQEVKNVLSEFVNSNRIFTAYDVTVEARNRTSSNIDHKLTRNFIRKEFCDGSNMSNYRCSSISLINHCQAIVFYPDGEDPMKHPMALVAQNNTSDVSDDSDSLSIQDTSENNESDDEETSGNLTCEGRLNIPKSILNQVSSMGGSYDVYIDGTVKYVKRNSDGRVRLPKSLVGNKGPNFSIEVKKCHGGKYIHVVSC